MNRIHTSELPIHRVDRKPVIQTNITDRPNGFWYDLNGDWNRFCNESGNLQWIYRHNYKVDISKANILTLSSLAQVQSFAMVYGDKGRFNVFINWQKVAMCYDGIEVQQYKPQWFSDIYSSWFYLWDCASGCIWNMKNVKLKKI